MYKHIFEEKKKLEKEYSNQLKFLNYTKGNKHYSKIFFLWYQNIRNYINILVIKIFIQKFKKKMKISKFWFVFVTISSIIGINIWLKKLK